MFNNCIILLPFRPKNEKCSSLFLNEREKERERKRERERERNRERERVREGSFSWVPFKVMMSSNIKEYLSTQFNFGTY